MKAQALAIIAALSLLFASCGDGAEPDIFNAKDARQIEGFWKRGWGAYTTYYFGNGKAVFDTWAAGQPVIHREYAYRTSRDTVFLQEIPGGATGKWIVGFSDINTAVVSAGSDSLSLFFTLKRL